MMEYGADMPGFIEDFAPVGGLPYLGDVARLECARGRAYHAADASGLDAGALAEAVGRDPDRLRFWLHPSVDLLFSPYPVFSIWGMNQPGSVAGPLAFRGPEQGMVARLGLAVVTAPLPRDEAAFVARLRAGASFARAAEAGGPGFDPAPPLARLISAGLVTGVG